MLTYKIIACITNNVVLIACNMASPYSVEVSTSSITKTRSMTVAYSPTPVSISAMTLLS